MMPIAHASPTRKHIPRRVSNSHDMPCRVQCRNLTRLHLRSTLQQFDLLVQLSNHVEFPFLKVCLVFDTLEINGRLHLHTISSRARAKISYSIWEAYHPDLSDALPFPCLSPHVIREIGLLDDGEVKPVGVPAPLPHVSDGLFDVCFAESEVPEEGALNRAGDGLCLLHGL